tara:strand:- start:188 stop:703 length:516 start_codon:yes stop_codon:yes gene_type:complete
MDVLIPKYEIANRIKELAHQLEEHTAKYDNELPPVFICVLNGAYKFFTDLVSEYHGICEMDFVRVKSYNGKNQGVIEIKKDIEVGLLGKNLYIIDDIIDSGNTMTALKEHFEKQNPNKISTISLLKRKENPYPIDLYGFEIDDEWVVGYGLDDNGLRRNLNNIYKKGNAND